MKIKLKKERKMDLVIDNRVFMVGGLYQIVSGEDTGEVFELVDIYYDNKTSAYFLNLGGVHFINANFAANKLKEEVYEDFIQCPHCRKHFLK